MRRLTLTVTPEQAGRTVRSLLRRELHMADGAIARVKTVPDGICRNGVHTRTVDRVPAGDILTVRIDDKRSGGKFTPVAVPLDILYEDADLLALNKPAGYECSMKPSAHPSVMTLLPSPLRRRNMQPVGRLDVDTTGVLIFTDDGALQHRLIHPKRHVSKVYDVVCRHPVDEKTREKLMAGVVLDDDPKPVAAKDVEILDEHHLRMTLVQGKYHQVKRMIAACSNRCDGLHRSAFGLYVMPETLKQGEWVWLTKKDLV